MPSKDIDVARAWLQLEVIEENTISRPQRHKRAQPDEVVSKPISQPSALQHDEGYKVCTKCQTQKEATKKYFFRDKNKPDGWRSECKVCTYSIIKKKPGHKVTDPVPEGYKRCCAEDGCLTVGGPILPATKEFFPYDTRNQRFYCRCKRCASERQKPYAKAFYHRHPDAQRRWRKANPEYRRVSDQRRRAARRLLETSFTSRDWRKAIEYWNGVCAYCGKGPGLFDVHLTLQQDHYIPASKGGGYIPRNIVPACQSCNLSKSDTDPVEWITKRFGKRRGAQIIAAIQTYFDSLKS